MGRNYEKFKLEVQETKQPKMLICSPCDVVLDVGGTRAKIGFRESDASACDLTMTSVDSASLLSDPDAFPDKLRNCLREIGVTTVARMACGVTGDVDSAAAVVRRSFRLNSFARASGQSYDGYDWEKRVGKGAFPVAIVNDAFAAGVGAQIALSRLQAATPEIAVFPALVLTLGTGLGIAWVDRDSVTLLEAYSGLRLDVVGAKDTTCNNAVAASAFASVGDAEAMSQRVHAVAQRILLERAMAGAGAHIASLFLLGGNSSRVLPGVAGGIQGCKAYVPSSDDEQMTVVLEGLVSLLPRR